MSTVNDRIKAYNSKSTKTKTTTNDRISRYNAEHDIPTTTRNYYGDVSTIHASTSGGTHGGSGGKVGVSQYATNADYATKSKYDPSNTDFTYNYLNSTDRSKYSNQTLQLNLGYDKRIENINPEELADYNYLYATQGQKSANAYLESKMEKWGKMQQQKVVDYQNQLATNHPVGAALLADVEQPIVGTLAGAEAIGNTVAGLVKGEKIDTYSAAMNKQKALRESLETSIDEQTDSAFGKKALQFGNMALENILGTAMFGKARDVSMALGAYSETLQDTQDMAISQGQAVLSSLAHGVNEYIGEHTALDNLFKDVDIATLGEFLGYVGSQMAVEGGEEVVTDILNDTADLFILRDKQNFVQNVYSNMEKGDSKGVAIVKAGGNKLLQYLESGIMGGLLGLTSAAPMGIANYGFNYNAGEAFVKNRGNVSELQNVAKEVGAVDYADQVGTTAQVGRVFNETSAKINNTINEGVQNQNASQFAQGVRQTNSLNSTIKGTEETRQKLTDLYADEMDDKNAELFKSFITPNTNISALHSDYVRVKNAGQRWQADVLDNPGTLTQDQALKVYNLAVEQRMEPVTELDNKIADANYKFFHSDRNGEGTFSADGFTYNGKTYNGVKLGEMDEKQRAAYKFLKSMRHAGFNIQMFQSNRTEDGGYNAENGWYDSKTDTIYIDVNAGLTKDNSVSAIIPVFSHEVTHKMKYDAPAMYEDLRKTVVAHLANTAGTTTENYTANYWADLNERKGHKVSEAEMFDEMVAEACEDMIVHSEAFSEYAAELTAKGKTSLVEKLKDAINAIRTWIKSVLKAYEGQTGGIHQETIMLRNMDAKLSEIQEKWDAAAHQTMQTAQARNAGFLSQYADVSEAGAEFSGRVLMGSLFSGGGTFEAGLEHKMLDKEFAVEWDGKIASVYMDNFGDHMFVGDVRDYKPTVKGLFYLHASPSCKNVSGANTKRGEAWIDKVTAMATARILKETKPTIFTVENVKGYIGTVSYGYITKALDEMGYKWDVDVYKASDYGNATKRERMFIRAIRSDLELPAKPKKTGMDKSWDELTKDLWKDLKEVPFAESMLKAVKKARIDINNVDRPLIVTGTGNNGEATYAYAGEECPTLTTKCGDGRLVLPGGKVYSWSKMPEFMGRIHGMPENYKYSKTSNQRSFEIIGNGIPTQLTNAVSGTLLASAYDQTHEATAEEKDNYSVAYSLRENAKIGQSTIDYNASHKLVDGQTMKQGVSDMESMAEYMIPYLDKPGILPPDIKGKTIFRDSAYGASGENTTKCVRTLTYEDFKDRIQDVLGRPLTVRESLLVSQKIYDIAKEPQCIYCYVAADRKAYEEFLGIYQQNEAKYVEALRNGGDYDTLYKEYLGGRKDTDQQKSRFKMWNDIAQKNLPMMTAKDLATRARRTDLAGNKLKKNVRYNGSIQAQIQDALRYAQSASWAKKIEEYRAYNGDILKFKKSFVDMLNGEYGFRMYSFSDFTPAFITENMQMLLDASAKGLKSLAYTKDTAYADIFAKTGQAINISTFAKLDENGNYVEDSLQGASWEEAKRLRKEHKNVGTVMVATNNDMVMWALKQDWIDVVIPYHIVKTGTTIANEYDWRNFTAESSDKQGANTQNILPTEHDNKFSKYKALVEERGLTARFESYYNMVGNEIAEDEYMKLVNEVRMPASELKPVVPVFDIETAKSVFDKFVEKGGYMGGWYNEGVDVNQEVLNVAADIDAGKSSLDVEYGMTKEQKERQAKKYGIRSSTRDTDGNVLTEAQAEYFADSKVRDENGNLMVMYHGTQNNPFTVFSSANAQNTIGRYKFGNANVSYFTSERANAESFSKIDWRNKQGSVYEVYLDVRKPFIVNANGENSFAIDSKDVADIRRKLFDEVMSRLYKPNLTMQEANKYLSYLNIEATKSDDGYYELRTIANNSMFGSADYLGDGKELWLAIDDARNEIAESISKDDDWNILTTDNIVQTVLGSNELLGTDYDGIIINDVFDAASAMNTKNGTDVVTIKSPAQIKNVSNQNPTSDSDIRYSSRETETALADETATFNRQSTRITDGDMLKFLNDQIERGEYVTVYRSFQIIDGGMYAPMNAVDRDENGKNKKLGYRSELGQWEMATESPEIAQRYMDSHPDAPYAYFDLDGVDNKTGGVAYNPYLHSSNLVLNDQFSAAYRRNLITVECRVPMSEIGAYHAQYAKDTTGWVDWKPGGVAGKLMKVKPEYTRKLFVSRYMLPVRVLSDAEVATMYKEYLDGTNIAVPWNVVTPGLREELVKAGVEISYKDVNRSNGPLTFKDTFPEARFSTRDTKSVYDILDKSQQYQDIQNRLLNDVESLRERMSLDKLSRERVLSKENLTKAARQAKARVNSNYDTEALAEELGLLYAKFFNANFSAAQFAGEAKDLARRIIVMQKPTEADEANIDALRYLRNAKIKVTEEQKNEAAERYGSLKGLQKAWFGKLKVSDKEGTPIDTIYEEFKDTYGWALQNKDASDKDMLNSLIDAYNTLRYAGVVENEFLNSEAIERTAIELYNQFWQMDDITKTAVKNEKAVEDLRIKHNQAMTELRSQFMQDKAPTIEVMSTLLQAHQDELNKVYELNEKRFQEYKDYLKREELVDGILNRTKRLADKLLENSKKNHVIEPLKKPIAELILSIDPSSATKLRSGIPTLKDISLSEAWDDITKALNSFNKEGEYYKFLDLPADQMEIMMDVGNQMSKIRDEIRFNIMDATEAANVMSMPGMANNILRRMDLDTLRDFRDSLAAITYSMNQADRLSQKLGSVKASVYGNSTIGQLDTLPDYDKKIADRFLQWKNATPITAFRRMGSTAVKIFDNVMDGFNKFAMNAKDVLDFALGNVTQDEAREWSDHKNTVVLAGNEYNLTDAQIMSIYALMKRNQAKQHMFTDYTWTDSNGNEKHGRGITISEIVGTINKEVKTSKAIPITSEDANKLVSLLSQRQKDVADRFLEKMNTTGTKWMDEVTLQRFGIVMTEGDGTYFPIKCDDLYRSALSEPKDNERSMFALLNAGFTQKLNKNADSPIVIGNFFDTWTIHMSEMAKYNGMGMQILDMWKWYSYMNRENETSVRKALIDKFGSGADEYIRKWMYDLNGSYNGGSEFSGTFSFLTSSFKVAATGANLSVALLQPTSYVRAIAVIDGKYLAEGVQKSYYDDMLKHSGIGLWKSINGYGTDVSRTLTQQIKQGAGETKFERTREWLMDKAGYLAGKMDDITWGRLWNACRLWADDNTEYKHESAEWYDAVNKKFTDVILRTQVVDSVMTRSQFMRSKAEVDKMVTSFMSEPTVSYNLLLDAYLKFRNDARKQGVSTAWSNNARAITTTIASVAMADALSALIHAFASAWRDPDDDKFIEDFGEALKGSLADDMSIIKKIPYVSDIVDIFENAISGKYYSNDDMLTAWATSLINAVTRLAKDLANGKVSWKTANNMAKATSQMSGIPISNVWREIKAIINNIADMLGSDFKID